MKKYDLQIAFTYVGAIVGAGFASGQELVKFFVAFANFGLWGVILAGIIFSLMGALVIKLIEKYDVKDYGQLLSNIFPKYIYRAIETIISISLWLGLGIMLIGSSTLLKEQFEIAMLLGFTITALVVYICLFLGSKGLLTVNTILVPILIILAISSSLMYISKPVACIVDTVKFKTLLPNWWIASLLYAAYNMVLGIVVLASIDGKRKKTIWGGILGGFILAIMAWIMVKSLLLLPYNLQDVEMPMLLMTLQIHPLIKQIYTVALWIALFTTALANAHSLATKISKNNNFKYPNTLVLIIISTLCFIPWKFSELVSIIYPILGYLGIPIILGIIYKTLKIY